MNFVKRIIYTFLSAGLAFLVLSCEKKPVDFQGQTMGTTYSVRIMEDEHSIKDPRAFQDGIDSLLHRVNMKMSTYIPSSEISRFNSYHSTKPFKVSDGFMYVFRIAEKIYHETNGAFDPTVEPLVDLWGFGKTGRRDKPPAESDILHLLGTVGMDKIKSKDSFIQKSIPDIQLDFSAIAKGYGVDAVAGYIISRGFNNFLVEIGGEVVVKGKHNNKPWRVGIDKPSIEHPFEHTLEAILEISNKAIATSGDYRNYFIAEDSLFSHTINPVTGRPVHNGVASATVIAPNCTLADGLATSIMVLGEKKGLAWVEKMPNVEAMVILREGHTYRVAMSSGFKKFVVQEWEKR